MHLALYMVIVDKLLLAPAAFGTVGGYYIFSLIRLHALKESFNAATNYYDNIMNAIFSNNDTLKMLFYGILIASSVFAIWYNFDFITGMLNTTYNSYWNIMTTIYNYNTTIPNRVFNAFTYFYGCTLDFFNLTDNVPRRKRVLPPQAPVLPDVPSTNTDASDLEFVDRVTKRREALAKLRN